MCKPKSVHARNFLVAIALTFLLLGNAGCQSMDREEIAWQALHAVDVAQTMSAARDPCYREAAWLTRSIIGEQPSEAEVLAWGVGTAIIHRWVGQVLERRDAPRWVRVAWDLGTIGYTGHTVVDNHRNGVRIWGDNVEHDGCSA
jgi:hypothetical protein